MKVDLLIIGGGINGAGIAADAAGRGLSVILCERHDLASSTSSGSSKLIHGGLRYLEHYEFSLVRKALAEREILLNKAPHIIWPLEFVLPHDRHLRPVWLLRLGLFLYDHLAKRSYLKKSAKINLRRTLQGKPLQPKFTVGFTYSDCWVDDARLVVLNAKHAEQQGATILTRTECISATRENGLWSIKLKDHRNHQETVVTASALVNAAGPWVGDVLRNVTHSQSTLSVKLVKGSHIVVPQLYEGNHAYILQNADKRIVFAIPYEQSFTLIGTTDLSFQGDPHHVKIDDHEQQYLCELINNYFSRAITPNDIVWSYAAVRPLYDDHVADVSKVTRDYRLDLDAAPAQAPLLSVFGGKITTYRKLAEHALEQLQPYFPTLGKPWTATTPLPGGDMANFVQEDHPSHKTRSARDPFDLFYNKLQTQYPWLPQKLAHRYARLYGTACITLLNNACCLEDLGIEFGAGLYEQEVRYLIKHEWACEVEDILWRRTKLGLRFSAEQVAKLQAFLKQESFVSAQQ